MAWESTVTRLARVLAPTTIDALAQQGIQLSQLYVQSLGDEILHLHLPSGISDRAQRALLSDPATSGLAQLRFDDKTHPPLDLLARPSLTDVRLDSAEREAGRALADHDAARILAAAPQLRRLEVYAHRVELGSHAGLEDLVLVVSAWPFRPHLRLPALKRLRVSIATPIDRDDIDALRASAPVLGQLDILDPIEHVLRGLRDAPPLPVSRVVVIGTASIALGRELVERPGNLAELPAMTVECRGKGRRWLDCFAGDRETRARKLAYKGAQWSQLFASCTEPPSADIVVDRAIAFHAFSPRERALRDCGTDTAQVLVYADWLEEQGAETMAAKLRGSKLAEPVLAIQRADDTCRDRFRRTAFVLIDAWRQLSARATGRESTEAFRERIHARLQNLSFRKLSRRDGAACAAVEQAIPDEHRAAIGRPLRVVEILPGVVAVEATGGHLVVVTNASSLAT